jgi:uncharacterized protein YfaP (DUF2135 family)
MSSTQPALRFLCIAAASLALLSCDGGSGDAAPGMPGSGTSPIGPGGSFGFTFLGNVAGTAVSTSGTPVSGTSITAAGTSTTSGADGRFGMNLTDAPRIILRAQAAGYAENYRVFPLAGRPVNVSTILAPIGVSAPLTIASGGTVAVAGGTAQAVFPVNALVPPQGVAASPSVTVQMTALNPATHLFSLPGDYTTLDGMGNPLPIESFGAVHLIAVDAAGARYAMAGGGTTAVIRIPAVTRGAALPATISLMYFDEATGRWVAQGMATLGGTAPNQYYEGAVGRVGFWTAAQALTAITVSGCVRDLVNQPVANARVIIEGISYSGASFGLTDAAGNFTLPLQTGQSATVTAQAGGSISNTIAIPASGMNVNLTATCLQVSTGLSVRLTWGAVPTDVDSHLYLPTGQHVYYVDKGSYTGVPYAALDVDDVTSFGPEVVTVTRLYTGTYRYALHNFSGTFNPGMTGSGTRVEVNYGGFTTTFTPPAGEGNNRWWNVFEIIVNSNCQIAIRPINTWAQAPNQTAAGTPMLCP